MSTQLVTGREMRSAEAIQGSLNDALTFPDDGDQAILMQKLQIELLLDIREYNAEIAFRLSELTGYAEEEHRCRDKARENLNQHFYRRATDPRPQQ